MRIESTHIDDTFAEAFPLRYTRLIVTAADDYWLDAALRSFCGYGTSVIACDAEVGVESQLTSAETPDGRCGASVLVFGFSSESLGKSVPTRVGQCLMTCPSVAVYDGLPAAAKRIPLGKHLRYFGDGFQKSKVIADRRYWRIPVMEGEFLVEESLGTAKGVAGGNFLIEAASNDAALTAARKAVSALETVVGVITPFPGGVARSGSKVGSRYRGLKASTADEFCPSLRGRVASRLWDGVQSVLEIVLDGVSEKVVARALAVGVRAAIGPEIIAISAGNYGGQLGPIHLHLYDILANSDA